MKQISMVVTIGLGYIGLPTSALIASHGTNVLGVDVNAKVVDTINQGKIHIVEPDLDQSCFKSSFKWLFLKHLPKPSAGRCLSYSSPDPF